MSTHAPSHSEPHLSSSKASAVKLGHLLQQPCSLVLLVFLLLLLSSFSLTCCLFAFPQKTPSADPASAPERTADSDESKAGCEEKTREERSRTASPSSKTESSANQRESALKPTEPPSAQNSPKSEYSHVHRPPRPPPSPRGRSSIKVIVSYPRPQSRPARKLGSCRKKRAPIRNPKTRRTSQVRQRLT